MDDDDQTLWFVDVDDGRWQAVGTAVELRVSLIRYLEAQPATVEHVEYLCQAVWGLGGEVPMIVAEDDPWWAPEG